MKIQSVKIRGIVLILLFTLATFQGSVEAQQTSPPMSTATAEPETGSTLTISDLVSSSTELSARLSALQRNLQLGFDLPGFENALAETTEGLKALSARLKAIKTDSRLGFERLSELKAKTIALGRQLQEAWKPLANRIKQAERWRREWFLDKERLLALESSLPRDESYKMLRPTIVRAKETINKATKLISDDLKTLLETENKAAGIQATADSLLAEIEGLLETLRSDLFQKSASSVFSSEYFGQFNTVLWDDLGKGFGYVYASQWGILQRNALFIVLQIVFWLIFPLIIIRNRGTLSAEPRLRFVAQRPFSAGMLISVVAFFPFLESGYSSLDPGKTISDFKLFYLKIAQLFPKGLPAY